MIERFIAFRYLHSGKGSGFARVVTWFSFIGIALDVATLIIVTSVMNGFRSELLDKIVGMKGHIVVSAVRGNIASYETLADKVLKLDRQVTQVIPQIEQQVVLLSGGAARGVLAQGISQKSLGAKKLISENIVAGQIKNFQGQGIFIGRRLADALGARLGDSVKLLIPDGLITPFGKLPKEETFNIAGIFEVGMNEYDKNIVIIPLPAAQSFFDIPGKVSQLELFLENVDHSKAISRQLANILGSNFSVLDWQHSDASIFHAVVVEKNVMTLILSIIVLVAMFNIISALTMLSNSKVRDIAILRTIGMTKKSILRIFFTVGSFIGISGTAIGVVLGLLVSLNIDRIKLLLERLSGSELFSEEIYFLSQIPSKLDWCEVAYISIFSMTLCLLAALYPARKAAAIDPATALRSF